MSKKTSTKREPSVKSQANAKKNKRPMIKCTDFNKSFLTFSPIDLANERSQQGISYPRYKYPGVDRESNLVYSTGEITLTQYGLPSLKPTIKNAKAPLKGGWAGYADDKSRGFIKVPIDPSQPTCAEVAQTLGEIDEVVNDDKMKTTIFGKNQKTWTYQPIVREPQEDAQVDMDDDEEAKPKKDGDKDKKPKYKYFKVKLDHDFESDELLTKIFIKTKTEDGFSLEQVPVKNETELEKYLTWGSTIRMIILVNKLWADKAKKTGYASKTFGITQKVIQLEIQPKERTGSVRDDLGEYAFDDDSDVTVLKASSRSTVTKNAKVTKQLDDPEDEEADEPQQEEEDEQAEDQEADEQVEEQEAVEQEQEEEQEDEQEEEVADEPEEEIEEVKPPPKKAGKPAASVRELSPKKTVAKKPTKNATSGK